MIAVSVVRSLMCAQSTSAVRATSREMRASSAPSASVSTFPALIVPNLPATAVTMCASTDPASSFSAVTLEAASLFAVMLPTLNSAPSTAPVRAEAFNPPSGVSTRRTPEESPSGVEQAQLAEKPWERERVCRVITPPWISPAASVRHTRSPTPSSGSPRQLKRMDALSYPAVEASMPRARPSSPAASA